MNQSGFRGPLGVQRLDVLSHFELTARMVCLPSFSVARAVLPQLCSFCLSNEHRKCTGGETLPGSCELSVNATRRDVCVRLPRITGFVGGVRSSERIRPCRLRY